jgi:hypothetical protein
MVEKDFPAFSKYRKKKSEKDEIKKGQAGSLKKCILSTTAEAAQPSTSLQVEEQFDSNKDTHTENLEIGQQQESKKFEADAQDTPDPSSPTEVVAEDAGVGILKDPALWPRVLRDKIKMYN